MKIKSLTLKTKIIGSIFLAGLLLSFLLSFILYSFLNKSLIDQKIKDVNRYNSEQVRKNTEIFKADQQFSKLIAERPSVAEFLLRPTEEKRKKLLSNLTLYTEGNEKYLALYLLDKNGVAVVSTDPRFFKQDYSFRDYYKNAIKGKPYTDVLLGKASGQLGYYFSYPVFDTNKNVIGVFVSKLSDEEIKRSLMDSNSYLGSSAMIVDQYGVIVSSTKEDRVLKSLGKLTEKEIEELNKSEKFLKKDIQSLQYDLVLNHIREKKLNETVKFIDPEDKETEILDMYKMDEFPFYLISEISLDDINNNISHILIVVVSLIFLMVIFSALFLYKVILLSLNPLKELKNFARGIAAGNLSKRLDIETKDEFGDLASVFNIMVDNLNNLYANLDAKVEEQTEKINSKTAELEDQKNAILNILEDVESQKNQVENLVNDLQKFKLAVDNASDQVVITDAEGIVIYGNKVVEKITGYKVEEAMGKKAGVLWKTPMPVEYYQNMWDVIKRQKKSFVSELKNRRKNGEFYTALISISPVLNGKGDIIHYVAIERDITKEKEIDKAKTEFVSLASHQLRTPLSAINWYTEMLLDEDAGKINAEQRKYLTEVSIGNQRMIALVNSLLNVSRLDLGTFTIEPEKIDIIEMAKSVVKELESQIKEKQIIFKEIYGKNIKDYLADGKLLRMVFQNLVSNAVKYTNPRGEVTLSIKKIAKNGLVGDRKIVDGGMAIVVSDSGIGIPISQQDKIFEKLFRADNARGSETEGTGLGLYIVKAIADQSGGEVWFVSEENKGTTFYVILPKEGMKKKEGSKKLD